jgi:hypothetical protein
MSSPNGSPEVENEKRPAQVPRPLDKLEQISRISIPIMIPVVIALIGFVGNDLLNKRQNFIEQKKIELEYVKIAKDVVSSLKPDTDPRLANWAYQTFFGLSPVKVSSKDVDDLSNRRVPLPSSTPPTVLGGASSSIADWPWLVSIYTEGHFNCNGTLIAPRMVLSAAQCVAGGQPTNFEVATAADDGKYLRIDRRIPVTKIVVHPALSTDTWKNDIAILQLGMALPPPFATIAAQRSVDPKVGTLALVSTIDFQSLPGNLLQIAIPVVDEATCTAKHGEQAAPERTICAGFERGAVRACPGTGSAGGPLVVLNGAGRKYQIGILSLAEGCSAPEAAPGIYTRVSSYADWIKQIVPNVLSEPMTEVKR